MSDTEQAINTPRPKPKEKKKWPNGRPTKAPNAYPSFQRTESKKPVKRDPE